MQTKCYYYGMTLGQRLAYYRERAHLDRKQLAAKAGTSTASVSRIEAGKMNPTQKLLRALAEALDLTVSDLIGDADKPSATKEERSIYSAETDALEREQLFRGVARLFGRPPDEWRELADDFELGRQLSPEELRAALEYGVWQAERKRREEKDQAKRG